MYESHRTASLVVVEVFLCYVPACCQLLYIIESLGRAISQAVSRRLPNAAARVQTRVWSCWVL
jgi:hypothetical protein